MSRDFLYPLRVVKRRLSRMRTGRVLRREYSQRFRNNPNTVFLVMTPEHGNIGDHAIAYAETSAVRNAGLDYIEITSKKLSSMKRQGLLRLLDGYPVVVNGGGYLGTLWYESEKTLRSLIASAPNSRILLMPNTIFYEDSDWGRAEFDESKKVYNAHGNLQIYAREEQSFGVMNAAYRDVKLIPDMVLSLNECRNDRPRSGCLICLRSDHEKTLTDEQHELIRSQARALFGENVGDTDMIAGHPVPVSRREAELRAKFDQFSGAELVITDRLHGMIFCAITGTPCVVVNSKSPKVRGCYQWIKDLGYIRFADDAADIAGEYGKIPKGPHVFDNSCFSRYFEELTQTLRDFATQR